jgi:hypothetical protein
MAFTLNMTRLGFPINASDFPGLEKRFTNPSAQLVSFHVFLAIFLNYHSLMRRKPKILLKFSLSYMVCQ